MLHKQSNEEKAWYGYHIERGKWENTGSIINCKSST